MSSEEKKTAFHSTLF